MLIRHALGITAVTSAIILATLLPFLPGQYDTLAAPLSLMSQVFGVTGLILVPVGALWLASAYWRPLAGKQHGIAVAALVIASTVWFTVLLAAIATSGALLGVAGLLLWIYVVVRLRTRFRTLKSTPPVSMNPIALYVLVVPAAVAALQMLVVAPAIEFSRDLAIRNSAALIADIEQYRAANGRYPESLMSVHEDYHAGLLGIQGYKYELQGEAYNLFFEQAALHFGVREFVMYNPLDQHALTSHKLDRVQLTPAQLALDQTRGHNALHDTAHPHWKYFWFD
jgi:hypothetical protein